MKFKTHTRKELLSLLEEDKNLKIWGVTPLSCMDYDEDLLFGYNKQEIINDVAFQNDLEDLSDWDFKQISLSDKEISCKDFLQSLQLDLAWPEKISVHEWIYEDNSLFPMEEISLWENNDCLILHDEIVLITDPQNAKEYYSVFRV